MLIILHPPRGATLFNVRNALHRLDEALFALDMKNKSAVENDALLDGLAKDCELIVKCAIRYNLPSPMKGQIERMTKDVQRMLKEHNHWLIVSRATIAHSEPLIATQNPNKLGHLMTYYRNGMLFLNNEGAKNGLPVAFRMLEGQVIALFPSLTWNGNHDTCTSYMEVGQHAEASLELLNNPKARPEQYIRLLMTLRQTYRVPLVDVEQ